MSCLHWHSGMPQMVRARLAKRSTTFIPLATCVVTWSVKRSLESITTPNHLITGCGESSTSPRAMVGVGLVVFLLVSRSHWLFALSKAAPYLLPQASSWSASVWRLFVTSSTVGLAVGKATSLMKPRDMVSAILSVIRSSGVL